VVRQLRALTRPPRAHRRLARHARLLGTALYQNRVLGLKLVLTAVGAMIVTLAVINTRHSGKVSTKLYADQYEPSFYSQQLSRTKPVEAADQSNWVKQSYFPRVVKTERFLDPQRSQIGAPSLAAATSNIIPNSLKANGVTLEDMQHPDGSLRLRIPLRGSLQNPAWSPDGKSIAFTRFRNGYNKGPADVYVFDLVTNKLQQIAADGSDNVSQPGSTWNARTGQIVFSSDRDGHDEIWLANADGSRLQKVTSRSSDLAFEPSFAPSGKALVFESHALRGGRQGRIILFEINQNRYVNLTGRDEDCRQPNWSPRGDYILYQKHDRGRWDIWLYNLKTKQHRSATAMFEDDKTDATFSPDGRFIVYAGKVPGRAGEGLVALPVEGGRPIPVTRKAGYQGAPSWSPDGTYVAMEESTHDRGRAASTELIITPIQESIVRLSFDSRREP
jgi:TolB protein